MTESDKTAAAVLMLKTNGQLLALSLLLVFALAVLDGWLCNFTNARAGALIGVAVASLLLAANALLTARAMAHLSGLGFCGFWNHRDATRLLYRQCIVLIVAALIAAMAVLLA